MSVWFDPMDKWPVETLEGQQVEVITAYEADEAPITGTLLKADVITDEGECPEPASLPLWIVVNPDGETSFHDVLLWRPA